MILRQIKRKRASRVVMFQSVYYSCIYTRYCYVLTHFLTYNTLVMFMSVVGYKTKSLLYLLFVSFSL